MAAAVAILEKRYGIPINYEDAPHVHPSEYKDDKLIVRRDLARYKSPEDAPPVLVPRGGTVEADPGPTVQEATATYVERAANVLVEDHNRRGNPGRFILRKAGEHLEIVPTDVKNASGEIVSISPLLDIRISIPEAERSLYEFIQAVCDELTGKSGWRVWVGGVPLNLFIGTRVTLGAEDEPARQVLMEAFTATPLHLSWQCLFGPGDRSYAINVHVVRPTRPREGLFPIGD